MIDVEVQNNLKLYGLTEKDCEIIERELTFNNPQYEKIMKFSKWGSTREPKYIQYFKLSGSKNTYCAEVPIGYDLSHLKSAVGHVSDFRVPGAVSFPKFLLELRGTQKEALDAYCKCNEKHSTTNYLKGSIQLPTGKGKTILGIALAYYLMPKDLGCKTLIIVHKTDLVKSWKADIEKAFGGKADIGIIQAQKRKVGKHFTIATIQTLNRLPEETLQTLYDTFGLVIQDEMHHCPSSMFQLSNNFNSLYKLGLTATPERSDGLAHIMNLYFGDFCYRYTPKADEEEKDILPVEVIKRKIPLYFYPIVEKARNKYVLMELNSKNNFNPTYEPVLGKEKRINYIPFDKRPLISHHEIDNIAVTAEVTKEKVCGDILSEYTQGHSCVAFFTQKEHIEIYQNALLEKGVPLDDIGLYYGDNKDCDSVIEKAERQRKFITLATYSKATEGTNVNQWEVAFFVSSMNNGKNTEQAVGRIRRTKENGEKLKTALLYDYRYDNVYQLDKHGATRDSRYNKLNLKYHKSGSKPTLFSRGFS